MPRRRPALDLVSRTGSIVALLAFVVLGCAAGGALAGVPAAKHPTVTVTYGH